MSFNSVKVINRHESNAEALAQSINNYMQHRFNSEWDLIDIKFFTAHDEDGYVHYHAMIIYNEEQSIS